MPKRSWDNVEPGKLTGDKAYENDAGYCAHGQPSFPTWHRPYLAMFEVSLTYLISALFFEKLGVSYSQRNP